MCFQTLVRDQKASEVLAVPGAGGRGRAQMTPQFGHPLTFTCLGSARHRVRDRGWRLMPPVPLALRDTRAAVT